MVEVNVTDQWKDKVKLNTIGLIGQKGGKAERQNGKCHLRLLIDYRRQTHDLKKQSWA